MISDLQFAEETLTMTRKLLSEWSIIYYCTLNEKGHYSDMAEWNELMNEALDEMRAAKRRIGSLEATILEMKGLSPPPAWFTETEQH